MDDLTRLMELLRDPDPQIRRYALGQFETHDDAIEREDVLETLRVATTDSDPMVSQQANRSLVVLLQRSFSRPDRAICLGDNSAVDDEDYEGVALRLLRLAGLSRMQSALDALHDLALGDDMPVAKRAIIAIAKIGSSQSFHVLEQTVIRPGLGEVSVIALPELVDTANALEAILTIVDGPETSLRAHAVLALGKMRDTQARQRLIDLAKDKSPVVRANVGLALSEAQPSADFIMPLGRLVRDPEVWIVLYALQALARSTDPRGFDLLCTTLRDASDDRVRASAIIALGELGNKAAEGLLIEFLEGTDDRVRANAVEALAQLDLAPERLLSLFSPLSGDTSNRVRANVAIALAPCDEKVARKIVGGLLQGGDRWFVASGIYCLGEIQNTENLQSLVRIIDGARDDETLGRAVGAFEKYRGCEVNEAILGLLSHKHVPTRARIARAFGAFSGERLGERLFARFDSESEPTVRSSLIFALGKQEGPMTLPLLAKVLKDEDPRVLADAVEVIGCQWDMQAPGLVRPFLANSAKRIRANAIVSLWRAGELGCVEQLTAMLAAADIGAVRSGIFAAGEVGGQLRLLGSARSNPLLLAALKRSYELAARGVDLPETPSSTSADATAGAEELETTIERYLSNGPKPALEVLFQRTKGGPLDMEAAFLTFRLQAEAGNPSEAFRTLETTAEMGGVFVTPLLDLANGYSHLRLEAKALTCFLDAYRRFQAALGELVEMGVRAAKSGQISDASQLCKFLMAGPAFGPDIHKVAGRELLAANEFEYAFPHLLRAHITAPRNISLTLDYAYAACHLGRADLGRRLCDEILAIAPDQDSPAVTKARKLRDQIASKGAGRVPKA